MGLKEFVLRNEPKVVMPSMAQQARAQLGGELSGQSSALSTLQVPSEEVMTKRVCVLTTFAASSEVVACGFAEIARWTSFWFGVKF